MLNSTPILLIVKSTLLLLTTSIIIPTSALTFQTIISQVNRIPSNAPNCNKSLFVQCTTQFALHTARQCDLGQADDLLEARRAGCVCPTLERFEDRCIPLCSAAAGRLGYNGIKQKCAAVAGSGEGDEGSAGGSRGGSNGGSEGGGNIGNGSDGNNGGDNDEGTESRESTSTQANGITEESTTTTPVNASATATDVPSVDAPTGSAGSKSQSSKLYSPSHFALAIVVPIALAMFT
ncbi:hypothetical protein HDV05_002076 [Chytridiales sp. JEL 0842]|nr:hypothetical protein HDV05_002076 [Chytridiales sp. JEL 0842]